MKDQGRFCGCGFPNRQLRTLGFRLHATHQVMTETSSSSQISSLVSVSALSGSSLLAGTHPQQHAPSTQESPLEREIAASLAYDILASQKRSSDVAFGESQVAFEKEVKRVKLELQSAKRERDDAAVQCRRLRLQLSECQEELSRVRQELSDTKLDARARVDSLLNISKENEAQGEKADALKGELLRSRIQLEKNQLEISNLKLEVETARNAQGLAERRLAELQRLFDEQATSISQLGMIEEQKSQLESENASLRTRLEQALHGPGNASSLISRPDGSGLMRSSSLLHTTRLEQRVAALESENTELRRKQADLLVAQTDLEALKEKLARANEWRERALLAEEATGRDASPPSSLASDANQISVSQVQRENALLLAEQGQLRGQIKANEVEIAAAKGRIQVLTADTERLEASLKCLDQINRRQNKRITILQQERDMYRQFVDSYQDADATLASPSADLVLQFKAAVSGLQASLDAFSAESSAETAELRRLLSDLNRRTEDSTVGLQSDPGALEVLGGTDRKTIQELRQNIAELEEANARLKESKDRVELENECMRARGAFNPEETQVLHFVSNPADNAANNLQEELVSLRKENGTLKQRVSILQDRLSRLYEKRSTADTTNHGNVTMAVQEALMDHPDPLSEIKRLKKELSAEKWRGEKAMQMFASVSSEFREACGLLFGYNLVMRQSGVYKVQLRCSLHSGEFLKFTRHEGGVRLTEYPPSLCNNDELHQMITSELPAPQLLARLLLTTTEKPELSTMLM
ncbi:Mitotic spindle assembly checkpoint protein MAD1 [Sparganum proliferum]